MSIRAPQRLLRPDVPWFNPANGHPTDAFFVYMRELDAAMRRVIAMTTPVTFAALPTSATAGDLAFVSDGRKPGEGGGAGTGTLAYFDGTAWRAVETGSTVAA